MKLQNKQTGEIIETIIVDHGAEWEMRNAYTDEDAQIYNSLTELNAEWEDYEEPKEYWYINASGEVNSICEEDENEEDTKSCEEIGNYFSSREEAELAVRKLKAWKRLKDRHLRFNLNYSTDGATINHKDVIMCRIEAYFDDKWEEENMKAEEDLDLLLGGEE